MNGFRDRKTVRNSTLMVVFLFDFGHVLAHPATLSAVGVLYRTSENATTQALTVLPEPGATGSLSQNEVTPCCPGLYVLVVAGCGLLVGGCPTGIGGNCGLNIIEPTPLLAGGCLWGLVALCVISNTWSPCVKGEGRILSINRGDYLFLVQKATSNLALQRGDENAPRCSIECDLS